MNTTTYPPHYDKIKEWVRTQGFITISLLERQFNLNYARAKLIITALHYDGLIPLDSDRIGRFTVWK
jgi:DNA segregation ATPase FtsK/SpoIIIE-like protein